MEVPPPSHVLEDLSASVAKFHNITTKTITIYVQFQFCLTNNISFGFIPPL